MSAQEPMRTQPAAGDEHTAESSGTRRLRARSLLGFPLLLALVFYAPHLLGLRTFPRGDFTDHFLPFSLFHHAALRGGYLPVWNPYTYSGHPFLADIQAAIFYPLANAILLASLPFDGAAARLYLLQVEAVVHVALAGAFCGLLVRTLTGSTRAGLVAGSCFAFSGYLTGYPPLQLAVLRTAVWLPLILWCVLQAWSGPRAIAWWLGAGAALAVAFLGGHPQTFLYIVYALAAWIGLLAASSWGHGTLVTSGLAGAALMALSALGLSAAQWLPTLEFLRLSVRADVSYAYVSGGLPLQDSWQLLLPGVLTQYSPLYIGVGGLQLALVALIWAAGVRSLGTPLPRALVSWRAGIAFFAGLALLGLMASFGEHGLLYPLLYRVAPGWNLFRGQERAAFWVALGLAVTAGYGVALLPAVDATWRRRAALWSGALTVAGVYAFGLLWQVMGRSAIGHGRYLLIATLTLVVGMAVALVVWLPGWTRRRTQVLIALSVLPLFAANMGTNLDAGTPAQKVQMAPEVAAVQQAAAPAAGRVYNEYRIFDDYGMRAAVEDVWGSSPLRLARYARLFEQFPLDRMWRLLGVELVLTWRRELFGPSTLLAEFPQASDTTYLHRLPDPAPRAWFVERVQVVDDSAAWQALADHQVDLDTVALVAEAVPVDLGSLTPRPVAWARLTHNRIQVQAGAGKPGFLVVAENWMPGWRVQNVACSEAVACAAESGMMLQPVRANLTLLGLAVPSGEVRFDLVYAPDSVRIGLWISGVTLALVAAASAWLWLHGRGDTL